MLVMFHEGRLEDALCKVSHTAFRVKEQDDSEIFVR